MSDGEERDGERRARLIDEGAPAGRPASGNRAELFLLDLAAIAEGVGDSENARLAKSLGLRRLDQTERFP